MSKRSPNVEALLTRLIQEPGWHALPAGIANTQSALQLEGKGWVVFDRKARKVRLASPETGHDAPAATLAPADTPKPVTGLASDAEAHAKATADWRLRHARAV